MPTCRTTSRTKVAPTRASTPSSRPDYAGADDAEDPVRQDLGGPRGRRQPALHRPAPRARGHVAAGVRVAAPGGPPGAPAGPYAGDRGPQRADRRIDGGGPDPRPSVARAGRDARGQRQAVRRPDLLDRLRAPG